MAEVALTDISYGSQGRTNADGSITEVKAAQTIKAGDKIPSGTFDKAELDRLRESGAVGDDGDSAHPTPQSTSASLQSPEGEAMAATSIPPQAADEDETLSSSDQKLVDELDRNTNQVARGTDAAKESKNEGKAKA